MAAPGGSSQLRPQGAEDPASPHPSHEGQGAGEAGHLRGAALTPRVAGAGRGSGIPRSRQESGSGRRPPCRFRAPSPPVSFTVAEVARAKARQAFLVRGRASEEPEGLPTEVEAAIALLPPHTFGARYLA